MSEEGASFAVLGVDIDVLGAAVARYWGLDDTVLPMLRRLPLAAVSEVELGPVSAKLVEARGTRR